MRSTDTPRLRAHGQGKHRRDHPRRSISESAWSAECMASLVRALSSKGGRCVRDREERLKEVYVVNGMD